MKAKISSENFKTNEEMTNKEVLRYCETFSAYISHIVHFFNEPLVDAEITQCRYLIARLGWFINSCPPTYANIAARYQRVITRLEKCLILNDQKNENSSSQQPSAN